MVLRRLRPGSGLLPVGFHERLFTNVCDMDRMRINDRQKNNDPIHITADDRESKSKVIMSLSEMENVNVSIRRLSMGDYQIGSRVIVERKTLKDFAISIIDGRLFKQMIRLANSTFQGVLIAVNCNPLTASEEASPIRSDGWLAKK